jgi:hypothetical protein
MFVHVVPLVAYLPHLGHDRRDGFPVILHPNGSFPGLRFSVFHGIGTLFVSCFVRSSKSQSAILVIGVLEFTGLTVRETQDINEQRRRRLRFAEEPQTHSVWRTVALLRVINVFQLRLKLRGWGRSHQPSLSSYSRRP